MYGTLHEIVILYERHVPVINLSDGISHGKDRCGVGLGDIVCKYEERPLQDESTKQITFTRG